MKSLLIPQQSKKESCAVDRGGLLYYRRPCQNNNDSTCVASTLRKDRHERFHSPHILPCTEIQISEGRCDHLPSIGLTTNPCFSSNFLIDVSNNGDKFSGDATFIPYNNSMANILGVKRKAL